MWFFISPEIVYGEDALSFLDELQGNRAIIVTDPTLHRMGFTDRIEQRLHVAGIETVVFAEVEPEPSLQTVRRGVELMRQVQPDWIVGLGGGSAMDAAKAMRALYERPDLAPEEISPVFPLNLKKTKMVAIPTTAGTGSEVTWMVVLTDIEGKRKLGLGNRELTPNVAIVDPELTRWLPRQITADTGIDALTHAVEGFTVNWRSEFTDGLCLTAIRLVFDYLPRAVALGGADEEARLRMANAATIAGLGFGNSYPALAHAMGHSLGAYFKIPHGRAVGLFLPYTMEFTLNGGGSRYGEIARFLGFTASQEEVEAGRVLIAKIRELQRTVEQPATLAELGIAPADFQGALETIVHHAEIDAGILSSPRMPDTSEMEQLFVCAYSGKPVDF